MQDDNRNKAPAGEPQETVSNDGESRRSRIAGRLRDSFGTARDGLAGTVDTVTGTAFREQFEDFTDAVTTTVVGVHQDQAEIRERLTLLEQRSEPTAIPMASRRTSLFGLAFTFGIVSVLALIVSFIALLKAFGVF